MTDTSVRLEQKLIELKMIMDDIVDIVDSIECSHIKNRAQSYWIPHIYMAVDNEHQWMGGSMVTGMDTVEELNNV